MKLETGKNQIVDHRLRIVVHIFHVLHDKFQNYRIDSPAAQKLACTAYNLRLSTLDIDLEKRNLIDAEHLTSII